MLAALLPALPAQSGTQPPQKTEIKSAEDLVAAMRSREKALKSAALAMRTRGSYPDGVHFVVEGSIRVLFAGHGGDTPEKDAERKASHVHMRLVTRYVEEDLEMSWEMAKRPDGVWMRETDPGGDVFTKMDAELVARMEAAAAKQGAPVAGAPGAIGPQGGEPLGSAVVDSLARRFDLALSRIEVDGEPHFELTGGARTGDDEAEDPGLVPAHKVTLLVRERDMALVRMVQLDAAGDEIVRMDITELALDGELDPSTFAVALPPGEAFIDVREHPPAWAQIRRALEDAEAAGGDDPAAKKARGKKKR